MLSGIQLYLIFLCLAKKYYKRHSPKPQKKKIPKLPAYLETYGAVVVGIVW
jgi:hypothetical protein